MYRQLSGSKIKVKKLFLVDKALPGNGASMGNAGLLAQWAMVPVNAPELWKSAPKYLLSKSSPYFFEMALFSKITAVVN